MKRPILFSGPMVRAILDGRKTQTRRIIKAKCSDPQQGITLPTLMANVSEWRLQEERWFGIDGYDTLVFSDCPYGIPGDRLWVRECWSLHCANSGECLHGEYDLIRRDRLHFFQYRADTHAGLEKKNGDHRWRPSIHMPEAASRINLYVTGIRVERLHEISEDDAIAEGAMSQLCSDKSQSDAMKFTHRNGFINLWYQINGSESWATNPWVWVIEWPQLKVNA